MKERLPEYVTVLVSHRKNNRSSHEYLLWNPYLEEDKFVDYWKNIQDLNKVLEDRSLFIGRVDVCPPSKGDPKHWFCSLDSEGDNNLWGYLQPPCHHTGESLPWIRHKGFSQDDYDEYIEDQEEQAKNHHSIDDTLRIFSTPVKPWTYWASLRK
jgi:hypothetical protein